MGELIKTKTQSIARTPELIAAEINSIKEQTRRIVLYNSIEIGRRLMEAKEMLNHGEWGEWLETAVDYSQRTANNLMRIFQEYGSEQLTLLDNNIKSQAFANLSYTQAVALLGINPEEREDFVKDIDIENMSTRELQKAIKEKQELEKKLKLAEKKAEEEKLAKETVSKSYNKLEKTNQKHYEQSEKLKKELEKLKFEKESSEIEIKKLQESITDIKNQLEEAERNGDNAEVEKLQDKLNKIEGELASSRNKINELEQRLQEKPKDVIVGESIVEKIPEEIERELQELREKVKQQPQGNETLVKFKINFENTVGSIKGLLTTLAEIQESNKDEYDKYKNAVTGLINKMLENL